MKLNIKELLDHVILPEKALTREVTDEEVFEELMHRGLEIRPVDDSADTGDFVRFAVTLKSDEASEMQVCIGKKYDKDYENVLRGMKPGEEKEGVFFGIESKVKVLSVKRLFETGVTDAAVQKLGLPGVQSLDDYRNYYVAQNEPLLRDRIMMKIMPDIIAQMVDKTEVEVNEEQVRNVYDQKKQQLLDSLGCDEAKYLDYMRDQYGGEGRNSLEECETAMENECRNRCKKIVIAKSTAREDAEKSANKLYENFIEDSIQAGKTLEKIQTDNPYEDFEEAYYLQHMEYRIKNYFDSEIRFCFTRNLYS